MALTLNGAAKATGKTKPAILKSIQKGKISAEKDEHGHWAIEPAELFRVYEPVKQETESNDNQGGNQLTTGTPELTIKINQLESEVHVLNERVRDRNERIDELKEERHQWQEQAQRLLLMDQRHQEATEKAREQQDAEKALTAASTATTFPAGLLGAAIGMMVILMIFLVAYFIR